MPHCQSLPLESTTTTRKDESATKCVPFGSGCFGAGGSDGGLAWVVAFGCGAPCYRLCQHESIYFDGRDILIMCTSWRVCRMDNLPQAQPTPQSGSGDINTKECKGVLEGHTDQIYGVNLRNGQLAQRMRRSGSGIL